MRGTIKIFKNGRLLSTKRFCRKYHIKEALKYWRELYRLDGYEITICMDEIPSRHSIEAYAEFINRGFDNCNAKPIKQYDMKGSYLKTYVSILEASEQSGVSPSVIIYCAKGLFKQAGGYKWEYA